MRLWADGKLALAWPTSAISSSRRLTSVPSKNKPKDTQKSQSFFSAHAATILLLVACLGGVASLRVG
jgi:hypothetical protein